MHPVGFVDQVFLWLERENQPMHVGAVLLLTPPGDPRSFVEELLASVRSVTKAEAPFDRRAVRRLGGWFWEKSPAIDVDSHVHAHELPEGSAEETLFSALSQLHARPLDRDKPLWEMHVVSGIEGGKIALYVKVHHALADGMAVARRLARSLSITPQTRAMTPFWAMPRARGTLKAAKHRWTRWTRLGTGATAPIRSFPKVLEELRRCLVRHDGVTPFDAPRSILNQRVGPERRFATTHWSLERLRATSGALGITLNDLLLAMCASALRQYLLERSALPDAPLVAMVPVALRKDDAAEGGNALTLLLADLATEVDDDDARLQATLDSVRIAKERVARLSGGENVAFTSASVAPAFFNMVMGLSPESQAFNVVISNVPGPTQPLFLAGARVDHVVPASIALDGQALNMTFTSYAERLELGIVACPRALPDIDELVVHLHAALDALEARAQKLARSQAA